MFIVKSLGVALALVSTLSSRADARPRQSKDISIYSFAGDVQCPEHQSQFTAVSRGMIPKTSPSEVWKYIGNYCNVTWYGFDLLSTTGTCNTPNSTRTISALGITLTEQLDGIIGSYTNPEAWETLFIQAFTDVGSATMSGINVTDLHNLVQVSVVDSGAELTWDVIGCSNNTQAASSLLNVTNSGVIASLIAHFA